MTTELNSYITSSSDIRNGKPRIARTGIIDHCIAIWYRLGYDAEEIARQYNHLTLAQVYAALAYYYANQSAIDIDIAKEEEENKQLEQEYLQTQKIALLLLNSKNIVLENKCVVL